MFSKGVGSSLSELACRSLIVTLRRRYMPGALNPEPGCDLSGGSEEGLQENLPGGVKNRRWTADEGKLFACT